jgi:hypothetical protein
MSLGDTCYDIVDVVEHTKAPAWDRDGSLRRHIIAVRDVDSVAVPGGGCFAWLFGDAQE